MRALITGGGGFVGLRLARALLARGNEVDLTGLRETFDAADFPAEQRQRLRWLPADARDALEVNSVVERSHPDVVYHLVGVSFPPEAERTPTVTYDVNTVAVVRLLSSLQRLRVTGADPVVIVVGSGMQYGQHDLKEMPLVESAAQRPTTVYAASKAAQEIAALQLGLGWGLRVICTRSFNHSGAGHDARSLLPSLVTRARRVQRAESKTLALGNDVVRDFLHVDDVVEAYLGLTERGTPGEVYNVCSGVGVTARALAERVLLRAGVTADITTETSLVRPADVPVLVGSPAKLMRDTGWLPTRTHDDIIDDLFHATTD